MYIYIYTYIHMYICICTYVCRFIRHTYMCVILVRRGAILFAFLSDLSPPSLSR